ncbi:nitrogenase [Rhizobium leguminosarum bv. trifolii]|uniref:Nitrogenase n=3 Tax=Rhizobium TaxID=379 RepID=A0A246DKI6_9HYPH|nr:nitrogenase, iron-molybdenum alpha chain NifD [Rhizobium sp. CCGE 510]OWO89474.1 nitrogenase [Rhizobium esperanzae]QAS81221.1 nitrogenase [Rhizobium acidisoli]RFB81634.1 nitrogenase [Rhizobium leguminosarum bv. trifolii]RFB83363.1 nitrogenase [Rhizobium leguminosarum bv. trifolii]
MSLDYENDSVLHEKLIAEVLAQYPDKAAKRRKKHLSVATSGDEPGDEPKALSECDVKSNIKSIPGVARAQ